MNFLLLFMDLKYLLIDLKFICFYYFGVSFAKISERIVSNRSVLYFDGHFLYFFIK